MSSRSLFGMIIPISGYSPNGTGAMSLIFTTASILTTFKTYRDMTAKKMLIGKADWMETQPGAQLGKELVGYYFSPSEMKMFCDQLCREQREICADADADHNKVMIEDVAGDLYIRQSDILNAPMPEI